MVSATKPGSKGDAKRRAPHAGMGVTGPSFKDKAGSKGAADKTGNKAGKFSKDKVKKSSIKQQIRGIERWLPLPQI